MEANCGVNSIWQNNFHNSPFSHSMYVCMNTIIYLINKLSDKFTMLNFLTPFEFEAVIFITNQAIKSWQDRMTWLWLHKPRLHGIIFFKTFKLQFTSS